MTLTDPLKDAMNLAQRLQQEGEPFRQYLIRRLWLVTPAALIVVLTSLACAFGTVAFIGGTRPLLVLLALIVAPFVLIGSLFVQGYVLLSWLEGRALEKALGHPAGKRGPLAAWLKRTLGADMGSMPSVPWVLAAIFLAVPLGMLAMSAPNLAIAVVVLLALGPVVFARLDQ